MLLALSPALFVKCFEIIYTVIKANINRINLPKLKCIKNSRPYRFGQATLVHVLVACAPLSASTGVVHSPGGAGHPVVVVAGMGRVVGAVRVVVVMVAAVSKRGKVQSTAAHLLSL